LELLDIQGDPGSVIAHGDGAMTVAVAVIEPGEQIAAVTATASELWMVVAGSGWVKEADGPRVEVDAGQAVYIERGTVHTKGSASGLTALVIEATDLSRNRPS
jgi:mannose-6-phosphate isomerase-like protein (cupin superfamily)